MNENEIRQKLKELTLEKAKLESELNRINSKSYEKELNRFQMKVKPFVDFLESEGITYDGDTSEDNCCDVYTKKLNEDITLFVEISQSRDEISIYQFSEEDEMSYLEYYHDIKDIENFKKVVKERLIPLKRKVLKFHIPARTIEFLPFYYEDENNVDVWSFDLDEYDLDYLKKITDNVRASLDVMIQNKMYTLEEVE